MRNKKRDALKSLIQKVELDTPSPNFTGVVMEEVRAQKESVINPALKSILKRHGIENASLDFTQSVIDQLEVPDFHATYKSIITKKAWLSIISGLVFVVLYVGFSGKSPTSPAGLTRYFIDIGNTMSIFLTSVNSIPSLYPIIVISVSGLLVTDFLLRIRSQRQETK